jgi:hypothetical protein
VIVNGNCNSNIGRCMGRCNSMGRFKGRCNSMSRCKGRCNSMGRCNVELLPFTISPLLSLLFLLYSSFFRFLLGLSSFGSVFTKTREKGRDKAPQERKNMREKAVLRN